MSQKQRTSPARDGTRILKQPRPTTRRGNITMAQARAAVRKYSEAAKGPSE